MEKKTTQRIIGMLVVIALVIILLPLLFGKNDMTTQAATNIKTPAMIDQPGEQVASAKSSDNVVQQDVVIGQDGQPLPPSSEISQGSAKNAVDISPAMAASVNDGITPPQSTDAVQVAANDASTITGAAPTDAASSNAALAENTVASAPMAASAPAASAEVPSAVPAAGPADIKAPPADAAKVDETKKPAKSVKTKKAKATSVSKNEKQSLLKLKSVAWAVQMGNFRNKDNATRLADKLRTAGYKAFTRDIKSTKGGPDTTRVYIGPEYKQASASSLSTKVAQEFNMHGYLVTLKPLEL